MQGSSRVCGSPAAAFCDPVVWFQVDVQDPRFQAIFTSHLFSLDPSHPNYRKTKAMQSILAEKQRRREEQQRHLEDKLDTKAPKKEMDPSLSLLVKSIKSKTQQFQARKKQKTA
uniref:NUC153 domain-containing protein n=1 Tax=Oryzias sinensis TaxID=183150 RepID=A0A8C7WZZ5_9TELE